MSCWAYFFSIFRLLKSFSSLTQTQQPNRDSSISFCDRHIDAMFFSLFFFFHLHLDNWSCRICSCIKHVRVDHRVHRRQCDCVLKCWILWRFSLCYHANAMQVVMPAFVCAMSIVHIVCIIVMNLTHGFCFCLGFQLTNKYQYWSYLWSKWFQTDWIRFQIEFTFWIFHLFIKWFVSPLLLPNETKSTCDVWCARVSMCVYKF